MTNYIDLCIELYARHRKIKRLIRFDFILEAEVKDENRFQHTSLINTSRVRKPGRAISYFLILTSYFFLLNSYFLLLNFRVCMLT